MATKKISELTAVTSPAGTDTIVIVQGGVTYKTTRAEVVALTDAANIATNASAGTMFTVTLAGNRTLDNPTLPIDGMKRLWRFKQDATGSRTITLGSAFRFGTDLIAITLTTTANKADYMGAVYNSTDSKWDVVAFMKGY